MPLSIPDFPVTVEFVVFRGLPQISWYMGSIIHHWTHFWTRIFWHFFYNNVRVSLPVTFCLLILYLFDITDTSGWFFFQLECIFNPLIDIFTYSSYKVIYMWDPSVLYFKVFLGFFQDPEAFDCRLNTNLKAKNWLCCNKNAWPWTWQKG